MRIESINCPDCGTPMKFRDTRRGLELWYCPACGETLDPSKYSDDELREMRAILTDDAPESAPDA